MGIITDMDSLGASIARVRAQINARKNFLRFANVEHVPGIRAEIAVLEEQIDVWKREWFRLSKQYVRDRRTV